MAGGFPQVQVEHVGRDHLIVLVLPVLVADVLQGAMTRVSPSRNRSEKEVLQHSVTLEVRGIGRCER